MLGRQPEDNDEKRGRSSHEREKRIGIILIHLIEPTDHDAIAS
jgi:hypothetical protein